MTLTLKAAVRRQGEQMSRESVLILMWCGAVVLYVLSAWVLGWWLNHIGLKDEEK